MIYERGTMREKNHDTFVTYNLNNEWEKQQVKQHISTFPT